MNTGLWLMFAAFCFVAGAVLDRMLCAARITELETCLDAADAVMEHLQQNVMEVRTGKELTSWNDPTRFTEL